MKGVVTTKTAYIIKMKSPKGISGARKDLFEDRGRSQTVLGEIEYGRVKN